MRSTVAAPSLPRPDQPNRASPQCWRWRMPARPAGPPRVQPRPPSSAPRLAAHPQLLGVTLVCAGVCLAAWPAGGGSPLAGINPLYAGVFCFSMLFPALDTIFKERVFRWAGVEGGVGWGPARSAWRRPGASPMWAPRPPRACEEGGYLSALRPLQHCAHPLPHALPPVPHAAGRRGSSWARTWTCLWSTRWAAWRRRCLSSSCCPC